MSLALFAYVFILFLIYIFTKRESNSMAEYMMGSEKLGTLALSMTVVATYISASSFVGGSGVTYNMGFSWAYLASIQIGSMFFIFNTIGYKFLDLSNRFRLLSFIDFIDMRYKDKNLSFISSIIMVIFFVVLMVSQFIGGAKILEASFGISYEKSLTIFAIIVITYTLIGGFKLVVRTDIFQSILMLFVVCIILFRIVYYFDDFSYITDYIMKNKPSLMSIDAGGKLSDSFIMSFWLLVGVATIGLPQIVTRCFVIKDKKTLRDSTLYMTIFSFIFITALSLVSIYSFAIDSTITDSNSFIITIIHRLFGEDLASFLILAPLSATMSTIDSMLLISTGSIIKDIIFRDNSKINKNNFLYKKYVTTIILGVVTFYFAMDVPRFIVYINIFAFGALESCFVAIIVYGLFYKRANSTGAFFSIVLSLISYIYITHFNSDFNAIFVSIFVSFFGFYIGNLVGERLLQKDGRKNFLF